MNTSTKLPKAHADNNQVKRLDMGRGFTLTLSPQLGADPSCMGQWTVRGYYGYLSSTSTGIVFDPTYDIDNPPGEQAVIEWARSFVGEYTEGPKA